MHREAVTEAGAELVRFARSMGLVRGEWVAIDGSKFQSVSSVDRVREREALKRYLDQLERTDEQDEVEIDESAVAEALKKAQERPGARSEFHEDWTATHAWLQRASRCRYGTRANRGPKGHHRCERLTHAVANGGSCKAIGRFTSFSECDRGRWLLQRRAVGNLRGPRHRPVCTTQAHGQQSRALNYSDRTEFVYDEKSDTFRCPAGRETLGAYFFRRLRRDAYAP